MTRVSSLFRIALRLKPYRLSLFLSILLMLGFVVCNTFSLTLVAPLLNTLFRKDAGGIETVQEVPSLSDSAPESLAGRIDGKIAGFRKKAVSAADALLDKADQSKTLAFICLLLFFGFASKNLFHFGHTFFALIAEQGVMRDMRSDLFSHLQRVSLSFYHREKVGVLVARVTNDVNVVNAAVTAMIGSFSRDPFLILAYFSGMVIISWKLTLFALLVIPFFGFIITRIGNAIKKYSLRSQERMADMAAILVESLSGIRVVKAFCAEKQEHRRFMDETDKNRIAMIKKGWAGAASSPANEILGVGAGALILWFGGNQVLQSHSRLSGGEFVLFMLLMFSMVQPLKFLGQLWGFLKEGTAAADRIFSVLDVEPEIQSPPGARVIEKMSQGIELEEVGYAYDDSRMVLKKVSGKIPHGRIVALVGPSGAGKSTLADLVCRFYDPGKGRILMDGADLRSLDLTSLRRQIGVVTQETILFHDTVGNNIRFGMDQASPAQVEAAAETANALTFIHELPKGFDTVIGDRGAKLSGGQRQRVAIARAILRDPPLLVLDEATSSLDTESERAVQEALDRLMVNRTVLVIAHRLSTIRHSNEIWVMKDGEIVDRGTHNDLMVREGLYRTLHDMQFQGE